MGPFDVKTEPEWAKITTELARETGMVLSLTDGGGNILQSAGRHGPLCARVRASEQSLTFICSQTSRAMRAQASRTLQPAVDCCDAGLAYAVVPVVLAGEAAAFLTACGLAPEDEELDPEMLATQLGITEHEASELAATTPTTSEEDVEALSRRVLAALSA